MTENKRFKHSEFQQDDGQYQYYGIEDTEKNFVYNVIGDGVYDVSEESLINILNELNNEVKSQSLVIKGYQERTEKVFNENEQLKNALNQRTDQCDKYYKENEQLKQENQRLEKQKNVLIDYMDNWCPKRFYDGIIKRMEEVE